MKTTPFVRRAGLLCLVGALIGAAGGLVTALYPAAVSSDRYSYPYPPTGYVIAELVFVLNHVLLFIGFLGLERSSAGETGFLGRIGCWVAMAGMATLTGCEIASMTLADSAYPSPGTEVLDSWYGIATILIGVGLVLAGVAVVRARRWSGWPRAITLACGIAVFVMVIPGVFGPFLAGRLVLTAWMLMFAALGLALYRHTGSLVVREEFAGVGGRR